jgi:hypothetical protein
MTQGTTLDIVFDYFFPDELFPTESEMPPNSPLPAQYKGKHPVFAQTDICIGYGVVKTFTIFKPFANVPISTSIDAVGKLRNQELAANSPSRKSVWAASKSPTLSKPAILHNVVPSTTPATEHVKKDAIGSPTTIKVCLYSTSFKANCC